MGLLDEDLGLLRGAMAGSGNAGAFVITGGSIDGSSLATGSGIEVILSKSSIPFIHISSASIGDNGALTGVTTLVVTYSLGAYCYFPANSIAAGVAAGWYWTVFSSATAGTIYNSTYTSGTPAAGTLTAFVTTGPGAYTGDTTERAGPTITIAANALGANGRFEAWYELAGTNNAGSKIARGRFSGASGSIYAASEIASNVSFSGPWGFVNNNSTAAQKGVRSSSVAGIGASSVAVVTGAVDTTAATTAVIGLVKTTATDNIVLDSYRFSIFSDGT
jgi:hypothetical protein